MAFDAREIASDGYDNCSGCLFVLVSWVTIIDLLKSLKRRCLWVLKSAVTQDVQNKHGVLSKSVLKLAVSRNK